MNDIVPVQDSYGSLAAVGGTAVFLLIFLLVIGIILARLYRRASKETGFVRTGFGGERVIINGGALVLPILHETMPVNLNTVRLPVERRNTDALITSDRMRIDVKAEFYVRVKPDAGSIAIAAQTLGQRTMQPEALKELIEGKFVDALRSVAAGMTMSQLHEQRSDFVQKVQQVSSVDLAMNGLELESVSLTGLDQTSIEHFNANNAFDAEGLTKLTEQIELRKKTRNDIEQDTRVQIETKNLEAERTRLDLQRETEFARIEQERELENRRAAQVADIARIQAEQSRAGRPGADQCQADRRWRPDRGRPDDFAGPHRPGAGGRHRTTGKPDRRAGQIARGKPGQGRGRPRPRRSRGGRGTGDDSARDRDRRARQAHRTDRSEQGGRACRHRHQGCRRSRQAGGDRSGRGHARDRRR